MRNTLTLELGGERPSPDPDLSDDVSEHLESWTVDFELCDTCCAAPLIWFWMLSEAARRIQRGPICRECGLPAEQPFLGTQVQCDHCSAQLQPAAWAFDPSKHPLDQSYDVLVEFQHAPPGA